MTPGRRLSLLGCRSLRIGAANRELTMIVGTRATLVWGTIAAAIASAVLLASSGTSGPRIASLVSDAMRPRPALNARVGTPGMPDLRGLPVAASASPVGIVR
jgi:hypothetical protein